MARRRIYLDNNSTTPCDPRVIEAMLPYFGDKFGNAASRNHAFGWEAEEAVNYAREQVCQLIGAESREVVFTSGATEGINLAIKGIFNAYRTKGDHIITVQTEHKAVLDVCESLEKKGAKITYLPVFISLHLYISPVESSFLGLISSKLDSLGSCKNSCLSSKSSIDYN